MLGLLLAVVPVVPVPPVGHYWPFRRRKPPRALYYFRPRQPGYFLDAKHPK